MRLSLLVVERPGGSSPLTARPRRDIDALAKRPDRNTRCERGKRLPRRAARGGKPQPDRCVKCRHTAGLRRLAPELHRARHAPPPYAGTMQVPAAVQLTTGPAPTAAPASGRFIRGLFGGDGLSFADLLDVVNPLQHIPVVSQLYRGLTGDTIAAGARLAGGALFGGPIGAGLAVAGMVFERVVTLPSTTASPAPVSPGGWMVAATRTPLPDAGVATETTAALALAPPRRRGGWMVEAAYAAEDAAHRRLALRVDTTA